MRTLEYLLEALPLNRKERYYTGTVLPALICVDNFAYLHRLTRLLPTIGKLEVRADSNDCTVLMFTEYGIRESLIGPAADWFPDLPAGKDTPDIVILVTEPHPVLIALEAKLYDRPSTLELRTQLNAQRRLLEPVVKVLADRPQVADVRLVQAALLPQGSAIDAGALGIDVITWEQVRDLYHDVAPPYFHAMLTIALKRYPELVSKLVSHQDDELRGEELVGRYLAGDRTYQYMGRNGGLTGNHIVGDVMTDRWRTFVYQCRREPGPNSNWFTVTEFIELLRTHGRLPS